MADQADIQQRDKKEYAWQGRQFSQEIGTG